MNESTSTGRMTRRRPMRSEIGATISSAGMRPRAYAPNSAVTASLEAPSSSR